MRNLNSLSDSKQVCLVPNPNSQSSVILGRSFSVTQNGLCVNVLLNATATFQRLMAQALNRVTKKYGNLVMCYVDDVVIATPTLEDHIDRLDEVFGCMKRAGLKCKPSKCEILRDSIKCLGRMVDKHGVRPDPETVEAVLTWKAARRTHSS